MKTTAFADKLITDYTVVDLETTGLSPELDRIIEIAAVKVRDGRVEDTFSTLVDPLRGIPYEITRITGISSEMVKGAPKISEAMPRFLEFLGDMPILGHNVIRFDMRFLNAAAPVHRFCVDTLDIANHLHTGCSNSLSALCGRFGVTNDNAHRALSDCIATHEVYVKMKELYKAQGAYFTMALACSRKLFQENIAACCTVGTELTVSADKSGALLLSANGLPVGTVSGAKQAEFELNRAIISRVNVSSVRTNAKGKYLVGAEVTMGGSAAKGSA